MVIDWTELAPTFDADLVAASRLFSRHPNTKNGKHKLGMIPRPGWLNKCRIASGLEPGHQDAGLDLGARDRALIRDRLQLAPGYEKGRKVVLPRLNLCAHQPQGLQNPPHGPSSKAAVPINLRADRTAREQSGDHPDG